MASRLAAIRANAVIDGEFNFWLVGRLVVQMLEKRLPPSQ